MGKRCKTYQSKVNNNISKANKAIAPYYTNNPVIYNMVVICDKPYSDSDNSKYQEYFEWYSYPLSDFQKYAIQAVVDGNHALVTAHTGSGKTLPAEFAIQYFHSLGKKVVYTSPIKALSNQKYHDFTAKYPNITFGLMTGDIKTNPEADVIIMTTEILMNYLFRGQGETCGDTPSSLIQFNIDIERELGCVVFDEIHYINDPERGQVWEKTILMLPPHIQMVMLSATIDSPQRFAKWCERGYTDKQVILASTDKRVVPLSHYGFLTVVESLFKGMKDKVLEKEIRDTTNNLIVLQSAQGEFADEGFHKIRKMRQLFDTRQIYMKRKHVLNNLALFLRDREMLPAIAFVFSRKNVEQCAREITVPLLEDDSKVPYTIARECESYVRKLPNFREYLALPEYIELVALLEKGIGIHHSGMIPILREIVELMISKKVIKLLFATESFAIGLDCPIKTAVMTGITKFDGSEQRLLHSHEYTQMAGRAGRRGIDTVGYVVHCSNLFPIPNITDYRTMLRGKPPTLVSKFRITYGLLLNVLKNGGGVGTVADIVEFAEKSMMKHEIERELEGQRIQEAAAKKSMDNKEEIVLALRTPRDICDEYLKLSEDMKTAVNKKRKEIDRRLRDIQENYRHCLDDVKRVADYKAACNAFMTESTNRLHLEEYIPSTIHRVADVLAQRGLVLRNDDSLELTDLGVMATYLSEVDAPVLATMLEQTGGLAVFSTRQIVGFLSAFTDVKVPDDIRQGVPVTDDADLKTLLNETGALFEKGRQLECDARLNQLTDQFPTYDIVDATMTWCGCESEEQCKAFIQTHLKEKEISVGDYAKAMLKISAISKELVAVAEWRGDMALLEKLKGVDGSILKYIATAQSLYV